MSTENTILELLPGVVGDGLFKRFLAAAELNGIEPSKALELAMAAWSAPDAKPQRHHNAGNPRGLVPVGIVPTGDATGPEPGVTTIGAYRPYRVPDRFRTATGSGMAGVGPAYGPPVPYRGPVSVPGARVDTYWA